MVGLDAQCDAGPRLPSQHLEDGVARGAEHLDAGRRLHSLRVSTCGALGNRLHVKRHRFGVGVDLDNRDLGTCLVDVLVERDHPRLVRLDEVDEARHTVPLVGELPWLEPVGRDEDEWA